MCTNQAYYLTGTNGNSTTISIYSGLIKVLAMFAGNNSEHLYNLSQLITTTNSRLNSIIGYVDGIEGYIDGVESTLTSIYNKLPASSWFTNLTGYVDGLETAMSTNNSRLSSILSAIQNLASDFGLETSQGYIWTKYDGTQSTITQGTSITDLLGMLGGAQGENLNGLYNNNLLILSDTSNILSSFSPSGLLINPYFVSGYGDNNVNASPGGNINFSQFGSYNQLWAINANYGSYQYNSNNRALNLADYIVGLNNNIIQTAGFVKTAKTVYNSFNNDFADGSYNLNSSARAYSVMDYLFFLNREIVDFNSRIGFVYADADTIQRKQDNASLTSGALDQITGSGSAAASLSDFTSVSSGLGDIKTSVSGGASASSAFAVLNGGSNAWDWFSEDCQNDMDTTSGSSSSGSRGFKSVSSGSSSSTPLLDQYYFSVLSFLGGDSDD